MNTVLILVVVLALAGGGILLYRQKAEAPTPITPAPVVASDNAVPRSVATDSPVIKAPITPLTASDVTPVKDGRTLYEGYVDFEPAGLDAIEAKLLASGCLNGQGVDAWPAGKCVYKRVNPPAGFPKGIEVFPRGPGMGPISIYFTDSRLAATKDISGVPDIEKFKEAVRADLKTMGNVVNLKEASWQFTKTEYPWAAVY